MYVCIYVCLYVCMYVRMYVPTSVCMHVRYVPPTMHLTHATIISDKCQGILGNSIELFQDRTHSTIISDLGRATQISQIGYNGHLSPNTETSSGHGCMIMYVCMYECMYAMYVCMYVCICNVCM